MKKRIVAIMNGSDQITTKIEDINGLTISYVMK